MKALFLACSLLTIFSSTLAHAFNEPTDFMGLPFNTSIEENLPKCPYSWTAYRDYVYKERCWHKLRGNQYKLDNFKLSSGATELSIIALQLDGELGYLTFLIKTDSYSLWYATFRERYGEPTSIEKPIWQSKGGVKLTNEVAKWIGADIHIELRMISSRLGEGDVIYSTKSLREKLSDKTRQEIKDDAKGL